MPWYKWKKNLKQSRFHVNYHYDTLWRQKQCFTFLDMFVLKIITAIPRILHFNCWLWSKQVCHVFLRQLHDSSTTNKYILEITFDASFVLHLMLHTIFKKIHINYYVSTVSSAVIGTTDYGHPMNLSLKSRTFGLEQTNWADT